MIARDSNSSTPGVRSSLRATVDRVRRSLFGGTDGGDKRVLTEGGRIDTGRLDIDDETVVHQLLAREGGRIKQSSVIEQTDWSPAKASKLLTSMENCGDIERFRLGREKVVASPAESDEHS